MNEWTQPVCRSCFAAFTLGQGHSPHRKPQTVINLPNEPCLVCGAPNDGIYVRADPKLTEGLTFARPKIDYL